MWGCDQSPAAALAPDYGEQYFHIGCYWPDPADASWALQPAEWRCFEHVDSDLVSGFLYLELENGENLHLCGEGLTLRSGIGGYDNLISFLTRNQFDCLHITEDTTEGNAFDWVWEESMRTLQIIWRPEDESHKMMTLVIEPAEYNQVVRSVVYYKVLN